MTHWAEPYIGLPAPDCWAFVRRVWKDRWGFDVPAMPEMASPKAARRALAGAADHGWMSTDTPQEGDAVLMAKGTRACHVGIWIEPDQTRGVLHWVEGAATVFTVPAQLGGFGYHIQGFWRHPTLVRGPR